MRNTFGILVLAIVIQVLGQYMILYDYTRGTWTHKQTKSQRLEVLDVGTKWLSGACLAKPC